MNSKAWEQNRKRWDAFKAGRREGHRDRVNGQEASQEALAHADHHYGDGYHFGYYGVKRREGRIGR